MIQHIEVDPGDIGAGGQLAVALRNDGVITFGGPTDRAGLAALARQIMDVWPHRDSDPDGFTTVSDRGDLARRSGFAGFGHDELIVHTESSAVASPPQLMMLFCAEAAASGGECRLVDGLRLHRQLAARDPELLAELSAPRSALFGGASGHLGSVFEERAGRTLVRLRLDELARFSPQITRRLPDLRLRLRELELTIALAPRTGYLLCNTRWLHGRAAFTKQRLMYRLIGNPLPGVEIPPGFAVSQSSPAAA